MSGSSVRRGSSSKVDFDRLLNADPSVKRAAEAAEIAASVGELIRQLRTTTGMTQTELADRVGTTQAHLSELERGLGRNGPTTATLARLVSELGDDLVVMTRREETRRAEAAVANAASWGRQVTETLWVVSTSGLSETISNILQINDKEMNPYRRLWMEGLATGFYMALRIAPDHSVNEIRSAWGALETMPRSARERLPEKVVGSLRCG
jgi:transcriptional regulator with XRE-family HTH domain